MTLAILLLSCFGYIDVTNSVKGYAAIDTLLKEFEVEPALLQADLLEYIFDLNSDKLVEII